MSTVIDDEYSERLSSGELDLFDPRIACLGQAREGYDEESQYWLREAMECGIDLMGSVTPEYSAEQIREIAIACVQGVDHELLLDEDLDWEVMREARIAMYNGVPVDDVKRYMDTITHNKHDYLPDEKAKMLWVVAQAYTEGVPEDVMRLKDAVANGNSWAWLYEARMSYNDGCPFAKDLDINKRPEEMYVERKLYTGDITMEQAESILAVNEAKQKGVGFQSSSNVIRGAGVGKSVGAVQMNNLQSELGSEAAKPRERDDASYVLDEDRADYEAYEVGVDVHEQRSEEESLDSLASSDMDF
jgi:hypothetical protein